MQNRSADPTTAYVEAVRTPPSFADRIAAQGGDWLVLIGRVAMAAIFIESGFGKLMDLSRFATGLAELGVPLANVLAVIAAVVEFGAGVALLIGWQTRYAAALLALFTIGASLVAHRYWEFDDPSRMMQRIQFFKNIAIIGGFLVVFVHGPGRFSVDGWRRPTG